MLFQILDQEKFKGIIKIKTIGSTYMASSGITETTQSQDGPRWGHLVTLVEFALELKKALSSINEQSFNHFVLKMGINHGPVTAGVIGARKPHYDIWGNTVNVASRMESTGKVGCIQVSELSHDRNSYCIHPEMFPIKIIPLFVNCPAMNI